MITAEKTEPQKSVKVKVNSPFRVLHPDTHEAHTDGDEITVPQHVADEWLKSRWVELVTTKEK